MSQIDRILLEVERQGLVTLLDFYNHRLRVEGPDEQILGAIDQLLELLLEIDNSLKKLDNDITGGPQDS
jgi:hypothetical protein